jgi:hypothetical protein
LLLAALRNTRTDTAHSVMLARHRGKEPFHLLPKLQKRMNVPSVIESCRPALYQALRLCASHTSLCAYKATALTEVPAVVPIPIRTSHWRHHGERACTRTPPRRRTALTMQSVLSAWKSLLSGWLWLDLSVSVVSTDPAFQLGS